MKIATTVKFNQIVESLKPYKPEKVVLFGSYVWGKPTKNSDIDLLIVKNTKRNFYRRIPEVRPYLYSIDNAFDILVMTPEEIKKRTKIRDFFIKEIIKRGRVLYEKR